MRNLARGSDGGFLLNYLLGGAIVSMMLVAIVMYYLGAGLDRAGIPQRWSASTAVTYARLVMLFSVLAGAALAILLRGLLS